MAAAKVIAKPEMRNLLQKRIKIALVGAVTTSILTGLAWNFIVLQPRKKAYADFYKTYDPEKRIRLMCRAGLLQSCGRDYE